jgi:hypothetical protein
VVIPASLRALCGQNPAFQPLRADSACPRTVPGCPGRTDAGQVGIGPLRAADHPLTAADGRSPFPVSRPASNDVDRLVARCATGSFHQSSPGGFPGRPDQRVRRR